MAPVTTAPRVVLPNKHVVDDTLWNRLVARLVNEHNLEVDLAEQIMDQALAFLSLCAVESSTTFIPSSLVDLGWHTFILDTRSYGEFCQRIAGRMIHHQPIDDSASDHHGGAHDTVVAMRSLGLVVNESLWPTSAACGGKKCYSDACTST